NRDDAKQVRCIFGTVYTSPVTHFITTKKSVLRLQYFVYANGASKNDDISFDKLRLLYSA
ncbi:hypothetical protein L9F63_009192, partial [Diploptera punctata]